MWCWSSLALLYMQFVHLYSEVHSRDFFSKFLSTSVTLFKLYCLIGTKDVQISARCSSMYSRSDYQPVYWQFIFIPYLWTTLSYCHRLLLSQSCDRDFVMNRFFRLGIFFYVVVLAWCWKLYFLVMLTMFRANCPRNARQPTIKVAQKRSCSYRTRERND